MSKNSNNIRLLRQQGYPGLECNKALQYSCTTDTPCLPSSYSNLNTYTEDLRTGTLVPVGSVEFVQKAMQLAGIKEPANISYPESLQEFLKREIVLVELREISGKWFVKPNVTKKFTGFVYDPLQDFSKYDEDDRTQVKILVKLPSSTLVWRADPVKFVAEWRCYCQQGKILGVGRYDDNEDESLTLDKAFAEQVMHAYEASGEAPVAYSLDIGLLDSGEYAVVEVNDAWSLGLYRGMDYKLYFEMLISRWQELATN